MDLVWLMELTGDKGAAAVGGLLTGLLFGAAAQQSRFCLRSAVIEFTKGTLGPRISIWLFTFGTALVGTQLLFVDGTLDASTIRQLSTTGTLSGAIVGGLLFGTGMIMARGCASRLLVLSATGNLRALVAGLVLTVVAQASLTGLLSPLREALSAIWPVAAEARDLAGKLPAHAGLVVGIACLALAASLAVLRRVRVWVVLSGIFVGGAIVFGWWFTANLAQQAFDAITVQSVSFTGPSADTLMVLIARPGVPLDFGIGLVPGVFVGSLLAALVSGEFRIQSFDKESPSLFRYMFGASLMGFGGMLAGGCAVGAGVTGGAVMAMTAWAALTAMWFSAAIASLIVDRADTSMPEPAAAVAKA